MAMLILIHGLPVTGKTTLARELAHRIEAEILSSDLIRHRIFSDVPELPPASKPEARLGALRRYIVEHPKAKLNLQYLLRPLREANYPIPSDLDNESYRQREDVQLHMQDEVERPIGKGLRVIVDATNIEYKRAISSGRIYGRVVYLEVAKRMRADFYIVSLHCYDESIIQERLISRLGQQDEASQARTIEVFRRLKDIAGRDENRFHPEEVDRLIVLDVGTGELSTRLPFSNFIVDEVQQVWDAIRGNLV